MENASKALIMAGGILISMLVISIGVYLFAIYGDVSSSHDRNMETIEIQKFNSNFTKFEGRDDITIHEIVSIVNFTIQYKEQTEIDIKVYLHYLENDELKDNDIIELIQKYSTEHFKCNFNTNTDIKYDEYGKVAEITFKNT